MPVGTVVTVPPPSPTGMTVRFTAMVMKTALTFAEVEVRVRLQVAPLQAPPKPLNWAPEPGVAISATVVPAVKLAVQVEGQLIPSGLLVMVPVPVIETVTWACAAGGVTCANNAPTCVFADNVNLHIRPLHPLLKPVKFWPEAAVAVKVTVVAWLNDVLQADGQLMPGGLLVTVPAPVTVTDKVTICDCRTGLGC